MYLIAGLIVGSVIGFVFAWFLFSWLTAKHETEHYSQRSASEDVNLADAKGEHLAVLRRPTRFVDPEGRRVFLREPH
jgi:hypothetical protein